MAFWLFVATGLVIWVAHQFKQRYDHFQIFKRFDIPGPPPSLLLGNAWEINRIGLLDAQAKWHRQYGAYFGYFLGWEPCLSVSDEKVLKNVLLRDFINFTDRPDFLTGGSSKTIDKALTSLKGQRWKDLRSTLTPSFTASKLKQASVRWITPKNDIAPEMSRIIDEFMENVDKAYATEGRVEEMYDLYQALTLDTICRTALGVGFGVQKDIANSKLLKQLKMIFSIGLNLFIFLFLSFPLLQKIAAPLLHKVRFALINRGEDPVQILKTQCSKVVKMRRSNPTTRRMDLLQLMLDAQSTDGCGSNIDMHSLIAGDEAEKRQEANKASGQISLTASTYETTSSTLAFLTRLLVRFPEVQERLREELIAVTNNGTRFSFESLQRCQFLEAVIQETLRLYPPIHSFTVRVVAEEKVYGKLIIPKGVALFVSTCELHKNPEVFPEPHEFCPDRFLPENRTADSAFFWQPFGAGPRNCIGMRFAQMEIKLTIAKLLTRYRLKAERFDPLGESKINVEIMAALQKIKDPLSVILVKLDE
ncbi:thromboxane-A synthase-like [Tropilaelaps mercedesae]|uniref:Thromboxane-A synthase-like n=1 Tax=Tropilaelaps mercedesae TaxID=418985 RepID=A0A1V9XHT6_9ACAR|nr:thromboxane-A synthase-like [Tropilaelaps mercedesae]